MFLVTYFTLCIANVKFSCKKTESIFYRKQKATSERAKIMFLFKTGQCVCQKYPKFYADFISEWRFREMHRKKSAKKIFSKKSKVPQNSSSGLTFFPVHFF